MGRVVTQKYEGLGNQLVYGHRMPGETEYFHIGSGPKRRAVSGERTTAWKDYVDHRGGGKYHVEILERYHCAARARLREMQLIGLHQPVTNEFGRLSIPPGIQNGHVKRTGKRCSCGAPDCYGAELTARGR